MSWIEHHTKSEQLAADAEVAARQGQFDRSMELYRLAADAEAIAVKNLDPDKHRTLGISVVSAVSLWYKAQEYLKAQQLAYHWLGASALPTFAVEQLQILLQTMWSDETRAKAGVKFSRGDVIVTVKGGEIVTGGAPLDLIVRKVEGIQSLYYRTTEFLSSLPHRKHGPASADIQKMCRPWLFQTAPSSYQFAVAIQESAQRDMFRSPTPKSDEISTAFMKILRAAIDDPDNALPNVVPDRDYRGTFLKLIRNLAPTGEVFEKMEIKSSIETKPVTLIATARQTISSSLRRQFPKTPQAEDQQEVTLHGILRAVHLDKDWLEITSVGPHIKITEVGETVDDVVGPMVNRAVVVQAIKKADGRHTLVDIQAEE